MSTDAEEARAGEEAAHDKAFADSHVVNDGGDGDGVSGMSGSLTAHSYDAGTHATAVADLHRLGDNLGRQGEIIRAAAAADIDRAEISEVTGLPAVTVDRALAPIDPEVFHAAVEEHRKQD